MIVELSEIVKEANTVGLFGLEQISKGHSPKLLCGPDSTNPHLFAWSLIAYTDYLIEATKYFNGQIIVDLGAGKSVDGYILSKICGAKAYIAVEHAHIQEIFSRLNDPKKIFGDAELNDKIKKKMKSIRTTSTYDKKLVRRIICAMENHLSSTTGGNINQIPITLCGEDMLTSIRRFPSRSVSVLACGIDRDIINIDNYATLVEEEIARVLTNKGAYLGMCSRFKPKNLRRDDLASDNYFDKYTIN